MSSFRLPGGKLIVVLSAAGAVAALLLYFISYAPLTRKLKISYSECKSIEEELTSARSTIESAGRAGEVRTLVTEENASEAINELTKQCSLMKVDVIYIKPKEITQEAGSQFKVLPVEMEVKSTARQFSAFIGALSGLKTGLIKIRSFTLTPDAQNRAEIKAYLALYMYLANAE